MKNAFPTSIIPDWDPERVAALERYQIFGSPKQPAFDNIVRLASTIFRVPIAHISFLDASHEFQIANVGLGEVGLIDRGESLCALAILEPRVLVVEDALREPILKRHPAVHGEFALRFYAGAPIITPDGHIIGTMCLVDKQPRTLTEHEVGILAELAKVAMEQVELRRSNIEKTDNLRFLLSQKDEFIGIASHELRTPLTTLKAYLQLIKRSLPESDVSHLPGLVRKACNSLEKLNGLIEDMLTASRLVTGMLTPEKTDFDILQAIELCCTDLYKMDIDMPAISGGPVRVNADPKQIGQAIRNLVDNAIKYASGPDKLEISITQRHDMAIVRITDLGPGIAVERLPKLFERYGTYDSRQQISGLGLGLFISADIIKSNGGEIGVESELGKGTTFWFSLPLAVRR